MSFPKTVLFLSDYQAPYGGSFLPALKALESALLSRGTACVWVFPKSAESRPWFRALDDGHRAVACIAGSRLEQLNALNRLIRRYGVGLIHAHFGLFWLARLAALCHLRLKIVLHVHSDFSGGKAVSLKRRLGRAVLGCIAPRRTRRVMVGAHMAAGEKDAVWIPNSVDFSRSASSRESREDVRMHLGIGQDETLVLLFGWTPYIKGVDVAARAVARLQADGFVLGVVTGREMTADKLALWLNAKDCTADCVRFLPPTEDVFAYHRAADVMLSASRSETFSYALSEALYTGRPCVISDIPGTAWAKAYETVSVFPSGDDAACAALLKSAAGGCPPESMLRVSKRIAAACSMEIWVNGVLGVYEDLCR